MDGKKNAPICLPKLIRTPFYGSRVVKSYRCVSMTLATHDIVAANLCQVCKLGGQIDMFNLHFLVKFNALSSKELFS